jgi:hypothetical protein
MYFSLKLYYSYVPLGIFETICTTLDFLFIGKIIFMELLNNASKLVLFVKYN